MKRLGFLALLSVFLALPLAAQTTDSIVCKSCIVAKVDTSQVLMSVDTVAVQVRIDSVFAAKIDTTFRDSTVPVPLPPPVTVAGCTHQPPGLSPISVESFDAVPPQSPVRDAAGWTITANRSRFSASGGVITGLFPKGAPGGSGPFNANLKFSPRTVVYQCIRTQLDANFTNNGNAGTKFGFYLFPSGSKLNHFFNLFAPLGIYTQFMGGVGVNTPYFGKTAARGRYFLLELLLDMNTGTAGTWVDGVQQRMATGVYLGTDAITGVTWNPTYGGGHNPVPFTLSQNIDFWFVAGR